MCGPWSLDGIGDPELAHAPLEAVWRVSESILIPRSDRVASGRHRPNDEAIKGCAAVQAVVYLVGLIILWKAVRFFRWRWRSADMDDPDHGVFFGGCRNGFYGNAWPAAKLTITAESVSIEPHKSGLAMPRRPPRASIPRSHAGACRIERGRSGIGYVLVLRDDPDLVAFFPIHWPTLLAVWADRGWPDMPHDPSLDVPLSAFRRVLRGGL